MLLAKNPFHRADPNWIILGMIFSTHRNSLMFKLVIIAMLLMIVASLGSGLFFLINDRDQHRRTVKALTLRISLSVGLFLLLMLAYAMGLIKPHGL